MSKLFPLTKLIQGSLLGVLFFISTACGSITDTHSSAKNVVFEDSKWGNLNISVCWEIQSAETLSFRKEVESIITDSFKESVLSFTGWSLCEEDSDIRIFIYDDFTVYNSPKYQETKEKLLSALGQPKGSLVGAGHPRVLAGGAKIKNKSPGLIVNRSFVDANPGFENFVTQFSEQGQKNLAISVALHEFGHAIGFAHEDAHPESKCSTYQEGQGGKEVISEYNPFSFMSRCYYRSYNYNIGFIRPNKDDIEALNKLYDQSK